jgi:hypothetical protein
MQSANICVFSAPGAVLRRGTAVATEFIPLGKTGIDMKELKTHLSPMIKAGALRTEEQGGKTDGARKILYFRAERIATKSG